MRKTGIIWEYKDELVGKNQETEMTFINQYQVVLRLLKSSIGINTLMRVHIALSFDFCAIFY